MLWANQPINCYIFTELKWVLEILGGVLEEVEPWLVGAVLILLFPAPVNIALPAFVGHRIFIPTVMVRYDDIFMHLVCHIG